MSEPCYLRYDIPRCDEDGEGGEFLEKGRDLDKLVEGYDEC